MCRDAGEFLRAVFKRSVPLVVVDLPGEESPDYWGLRDAADRAKQVTTSLVAVAGFGASEGEELWARKLGAWAYLSEANTQRGFEFVFDEARTALARREEIAELAGPATAFFEPTSIEETNDKKPDGSYQDELW